MGKAVPKPFGRPTKYTPEMLPTANLMRKHGATDEEIAEELGIGIATFYRWQRDNPDFQLALVIGKDILINACSRSVTRRALGMSMPAVKITHHASTDGNGAVTKVISKKTRYREHIPPDVGAALKILEKFSPDEWGPNANQGNEMEDVAKEEAATAALLGFVTGDKGV